MSLSKKVSNTLITFKEMEVIETALKVYRDVIVDAIESGEAEAEQMTATMSLVLEQLGETLAIVTNALDDREVRHLVGNNLSDNALENFLGKQVGFDK